MYFDNKPCAVCGSEIELSGESTADRDRREPDSTIDARICTNASCPTNSGAADAPAP